MRIRVNRQFDSVAERHLSSARNKANQPRNAGSGSVQRDRRSPKARPGTFWVAGISHGSANSHGVAPRAVRFANLTIRRSKSCSPLRSVLPTADNLICFPAHIWLTGLLIRLSPCPDKRWITRSRKMAIDLHIERWSMRWQRFGAREARYGKALTVRRILQVAEICAKLVPGLLASGRLECSSTLLQTECDAVLTSARGGCFRAQDRLA